MAWNDEIKEAAYTSPSGKRQTFLYENVGQETALKTASFTFPEKDGAEIQSLGLGGRTFSIKCIFAGPDCVQEANSFEELLKERGYGVLEHPLYGTANVVPTGSIKRTDNLLDGLNESSVEVTFSETITDTDNSSLSSEVSTADALSDSIDAFEDAAAEDFEQMIETGEIEDEMQLQSVLEMQADSSFKGVEKLLKNEQDLQKKNEHLQKLKEMKTFVKKVLAKASSIESNALSVAQTVTKLSKMPASIAMGALARIEGYSSIIKDIANNAKSDPFGVKAISNQFAATSLAWSGMVASLSFGTARNAYEAVNASARADSSSSDSESSSDSYSADSESGGMKSRADVLEAITEIRDTFNEYSEYLDAQCKKNAFIDTGETYEKLLNVVLYSIKLLQEASFDLPLSKTITLNRDRQIFELLAELYGKDGFDRQNEFINDNKLTADEIVLIPMGREVRYYV